MIFQKKEQITSSVHAGLACENSRLTSGGFPPDVRRLFSQANAG